MSSESRQWKGKTGGGNFGQQLLLFLLKFVKVTAVYPLLIGIIPFYMLFARKGYSAAYNYFHIIIGQKPLSAFCSVIRNLFLFGEVVIDKFAILADKTDQFTIDFHGREIIDNLLTNEKGFMIAGSHCGNFELVGHYLKQDKKEILGVVYGGENKNFQHRRETTFKKNNVRLIPVEKDLSHLFTIKESLEKGNIVTILCDRISGSSKKIKISFMGHDAYFPTGPFHLAAMMDIPIVALFIMKESRTHHTGYVVSLTLPEDETSVNRRAASLAQQYADALTTVVQKYPAQWFNFYDFWNLSKQ